MAGEARGYSEFGRGWPVVLSAMLGIGLGLSPVPFYTIGMFAPELVKAFGWSFATVMSGFPIMTICVLLASPGVGLLSDRFGVRRVALVSQVLFALCFMAFAAGNGSVLLYEATWVALALVGAGTLPVTWTRAVNNRFELRKGLALGLSLLGTGLFGYVVKPFSAYLIATHGWRLAYLVIGALPLLIAFPVALVGFHDVGGRGETAAQRKLAQAARRAVTPGLTFRETLKSWRFWVLGLAFIPISFAVGGPIPNLENILKISGFSPGQVVSLASLVGLSVIFGRIAGGWLIDRFWAPAVALLLLSAPAVACWILAHGGLSYGGAAAAIVMIGVAAGVEYDLMAYLVARYFGMKSYGAIYGSLYGFFVLGAGLAPLVFGRFFDRTHSYAQPLEIAAAFFLVGAILLLTLGRYRNFAPVSSTEAIAAAEQVGDITPA